jgi:carbon monoxide dehydrogenase subunit G
MKVAGQYEVPAPQQKVWEALQDPETLAKTLPGCEGLEPIGPDEYKMKMKLAMASVQGLFDGKVRLKDPEPPTKYKLEVEGQGKVGFVKGGGEFRLEPTDGGTMVHYSGDLHVGGMIAGVGQRLMDMTSKMMIKRFFSSLSAILQQQSGH